MHIVKTHKKGKHMNTLEKYHMDKLYRNNLHMNDSAIKPNNPIYKILYEIDNRRQHRTDKQQRKSKQTNTHARKQQK
jgi:hypothetical protein